MATSGSSNFTETRDSIITRALRICGALGQGETASTTEITEASQAMNDIIKALQADGMQLWHRTTISFSPTAGDSSYLIGTGSVIAQTAPLKVYNAWNRNVTTSFDTPMIVVTKQEYDMFSDKVASTGVPNVLHYDPPNSTTGEMIGTVYLYVGPSADFCANHDIYMTVQHPIQDFDASTDNPDFPSYWYECIIWMLAADLAYEYKVPLSERAMIAKKADDEHFRALSFDMEEGSVYFQPDTRFTK
jgi:hypothetical protein